MNISIIATDIIKNAIEKVKSENKIETMPVKPIKTSVPEIQIIAAKKIAIDCKNKLEALLSDVNAKLNDLNAKSDPSVNFLTSKEAFGTAYSDLKKLRKTLNLL